MPEKNNKLDLDSVEWIPNDFPYENFRGSIEDCYHKTLVKLYVKKYGYAHKIYSLVNQGHFKKCHHEDILAFIKENFGIELLERKSPSFEEDNSVLIDQEDGILFIKTDWEDTTLFFEFTTKSQEKYEKVRDGLNSFLFQRPEENEGKAYVLVSDPHQGLITRELGLVATPLIMGNYIESIHEELKVVIKDLNSPVPQGRLVILEGEAGCGKTFYIRSLIEEVPSAFFVVVPPAMVKNLGDPAFVPTLLNLKSRHQATAVLMDEELSQKYGPLVLIIEDADECLVKRGADNMSSISSILNFTSGILGELLDIRIIATTNAPKTEFDPALERSGRLSSHVHFEKLPFEQAEKIYRRLMGDPKATLLESGQEEVDYLLADVYALAKENKGGENLGGEQSVSSSSSPPPKSTISIRKAIRRGQFKRKMGF